MLQAEEQPMSMTQQAVSELSSFNEMISTVLPYGELTVAANGIGQVEEAHKAVKKLNASIEKKRKELKAGALEFGRTVDSIAKQLSDRVDSVEVKLKAERDAFDAIEKAEKAAKEAEKLAAKQKRLDDMVAAGIPVDLSAADLPEDEWMWWLSKARKQAAVIAEEKRQAEEFAAQQRKEHEELAAKMADDLRIRAAEIERQRLADEAVLAEQRKAMEAEREELRRQQNEIRKAAEAKAKAEREAAEFARLEALKPELDKAHDFAQSMVTDAQDSLARLGNPKWAGDAMHAVRNCGSSIIALVAQQ